MYGGFGCLPRKSAGVAKDKKGRAVKDRWPPANGRNMYGK